MFILIKYMNISPHCSFKCNIVFETLLVKRRQDNIDINIFISNIQWSNICKYSYTDNGCMTWTVHLLFVLPTERLPITTQFNVFP